MAKDLNELVGRLPAEEQAAIGRRAAELIEKEATLRELRSMSRRSQEQVAERLGLRQSAVSKMERRTDMYVGTLRKLVRAMGGELEIVARLPGRPAVRIKQFGDLAPDEPKRRSKS